MYDNANGNGSPLDDLKETLAAQEAKANRHAEFNKRLAKDIAELEKQQGDYDKVVKAYKKAREALEEQKTELKDYHGQQSCWIEAELKHHQKCAIKDIVQEYVKTIKAAEKKVDDAKVDLSLASKAHADAVQTHQDAEDTFAGALGYQPELEGQLKSLQDSRTLIDEAYENAKKKKMYFFLRDFGRVLEEIGDLKPKDALEPELEGKWQDLVDAKTLVREKQLEYNRKKDALSDTEAELKSTKEDRVTSILEDIATIPDEPPCPPKSE